MKHFLECLFVGLVGMLISYLFGAGCEWTWNPGEWHGLTRFISVFAGLSWLSIVLYANYVEE